MDMKDLSLQHSRLILFVAIRDALKRLWSYLTGAKHEGEESQEGEEKDTGRVR